MNLARLLRRRHDVDTMTIMTQIVPPGAPAVDMTIDEAGTEKIPGGTTATGVVVVVKAMDAIETVMRAARHHHLHRLDEGTLKKTMMMIGGDRDGTHRRLGPLDGTIETIDKGDEMR